MKKKKTKKKSLLNQSERKKTNRILFHFTHGVLIRNDSIHTTHTHTKRRKEKKEQRNN